MSSLNKVQIIGNLGNDPEVRHTAAGDQVTSITVATTDEWKDKASGEKRQQTEWHKVVFFKKLAEIAGNHLKKGSQVYIEGKIKTKKWTDKDGQDRYTTQIEATELKMLGKRERNNEPAADTDSDVPF